MAGNEMDLLKQATQAMMASRDDDANGFDSDTPRSGIATPQPDPSDKRLPGIMHSYFGQVGSGSSGSSTASPNSGPVEISVPGHEAESKPRFSRPEELKAAETLPPATADSNSNMETASAYPQANQKPCRSPTMSSWGFFHLHLHLNFFNQPCTLTRHHPLPRHRHCTS